jgi:CDP-diacylglycerol--serine O-phosphatidyltransferase
MEPLETVRGREPRKYRRGIFLLPSLLTVGNLFCGYACVVYTMLGDLKTAAPFIGIAIILDALDGRIARLTNTTSAFGVEFDSLADVVSFGLAPAVLASGWGLLDLGRVGWAASFIYVSAAAMRLARFNIQSSVQLDKRYFVGMPSPAAAGVIAATVYAWPYPLTSRPFAWAAIAVVLVPGLLMVSTIRFRSFKNLNLGWGSLSRLFIFIVLVAVIAMEPRVTLVVLAYGYLAWAFIEMAITRQRARRDGSPPPTPAAPPAG